MTITKKPTGTRSCGAVRWPRSHLPSTVRPIALSRQCLPLEVQIIGPFMEDRSTIHLARLLDPLFGAFQVPSLARSAHLYDRASLISVARGALWPALATSCAPECMPRGARLAPAFEHLDDDHARPLQQGHCDRREGEPFGTSSSAGCATGSSSGAHLGWLCGRIRLAGHSGDGAAWQDMKQEWSARIALILTGSAEHVS